MAKVRSSSNSSSRGRTVDIQVRAKLVGGIAVKERPTAVAYAFSKGGKLLASAVLSDKGQANLSVPLSSDATAVRVMVGPEVADHQSLSVDELQRRGAQELHLRAEAKRPKLEAALTIHPNVWTCWILSACTVRGTLLKRFTSAGVTVDHPVCNATVDVYEVDPWPLLIAKLPDSILDKLRDILVDPRPFPIPIPDPVPDLGPLPGPIPGPGPDPAPFFSPRADTNFHVFDVKAAAALSDAVRSTELAFVAKSGSKLQFQQELVAHPLLIRPLLCFFWPQLVTMHKVATAVTDDCGHFQAVFFESCHNTDAPDLYFKARQKIFGWFDVTIYAPTPIPCYTWWNYTCGTEVTLITTNPFAITCSPCPPVDAPPNWVLFTAIGNTSLKAIQGGGASGTTLSNWGLLGSGAPWGGTLRPRLDFDNSLRESLGVKYYQLSWRKGTAGSFTPFTAEVYRHYAQMVGSDLVIEPYYLGPNHMVVAGENLELYEIPPAVPPAGQWTVANAVLDTENGEFNSVLHSPGITSYNDDFTPKTGVDDSGLYQIKLELFDAAGVRVDIGVNNIRYVVPDNESLTGTIHTVNASTIVQPDGTTLVQGNAMILTLHVDNNHCGAEVDPPVTPIGSADACCGVVRYAAGDSVSMTYTAHHPHGYATRTFQLYRSATKILPDLNGGTGTFTETRTVAAMMSLALPPECALTPPCTMAAFSENLYVRGLATDGWGSYLGYDAYAVRAFALAPLSGSTG